ncbi:PTS sugar transporter subunit IIA [Brytella acorum]|uniref:PTS sugar transporter subunit IIA n=1 Tax=Brytella acorum TaxID=2959299 RepID=A0AA35UXJ5_9PROT|nr:PTS sugar transporter subunit IIA [Brytella acorum]CAI9121458.1 PTS sugar transporter subunit IIA [Brytella acorum]
MIGIVLITHGHLGDSLRETVEHVIGPQTQLLSVPVEREDEIAQLRPALLDAVHAVDTGEGVLLLTDIFGSTPSNLALSVREPDHVEVIAGVNMPMLVKLAKSREHRDLASCIALATSAGRKYIAAASELPQSCLQGGKCCEETIAEALAPHASPLLGADSRGGMNANVIPLRHAVS